jgi:hypothetical protein
MNASRLLQKQTLKVKSLKFSLCPPEPAQTITTPYSMGRTFTGGVKKLATVANSPPAEDSWVALKAVL